MAKGKTREISIKQSKKRFCKKLFKTPMLIMYIMRDICS